MAHNIVWISTFIEVMLVKATHNKEETGKVTGLPRDGKNRI